MANGTAAPEPSAGMAHNSKESSSVNSEEELKKLSLLIILLLENDCPLVCAEI